MFPSEVATVIFAIVLGILIFASAGKFLWWLWFLV